jgi:hypothetical protein
MLWVSLVWPFTFYSNPAQHTVQLSPAKQFNGKVGQNIKNKKLNSVRNVTTTIPTIYSLNSWQPPRAAFFASQNLEFGFFLPIFCICFRLV